MRSFLATNLSNQTAEVTVVVLLFLFKRYFSLVLVSALLVCLLAFGVTELLLVIVCKI